MNCGNYDVGKNILLPYLLDRGVKSIDYIIFSHFDSDHCDSALYIMNEIEVKNVIFSSKGQESDNYDEFVEIVNEKKINAISVKAGDRVNIENDLYFDILWPCSDIDIEDNEINNMSIVCKLVYLNFSMLFTGDIEEVAENKIVELYSNTETLNSIILKVAHHGSKSSSSLEFLNCVLPQVAIIGVGKNNTYGHPSNTTLENLQLIGCQAIYRTDLNGEISILSDGYTYKLTKFVNNN